MLRWMFWEQYNHEPNVATLRFWHGWVGEANLSDAQRAQIPAKRAAGEAALALMDEHLARARLVRRRPAQARRHRALRLHPCRRGRRLRARRLSGCPGLAGAGRGDARLYRDRRTRLPSSSLGSWRSRFDRPCPYLGACSRSRVTEPVLGRWSSAAARRSAIGRARGRFRRLAELRRRDRSEPRRKPCPIPSARRRPPIAGRQPLKSRAAPIASSACSACRFFAQAEPGLGHAMSSSRTACRRCR